METFLPTNDGIIRLIADIDGVASRHGITIASADSGQVRTDLSRSVAALPESKPYDSRIIDITFSSSYDDLMDFLLDLEKSLRIIDIRVIDFTEPAPGAKLTQYKVSLEVYWLKNLKYGEAI